MKDKYLSTRQYCSTIQSKYTVCKSDEEDSAGRVASGVTCEIRITIKVKERVYKMVMRLPVT